MTPLIDPLLILAIGIATVLGMILFLKVNAFISLITAAITVSILSGGDVSEKISRVAESFGKGAGAIGIVIALAAVIGKCMMDSGAADRIVRAFLGLLGVKRAPVALMGSGFLLAIPVFFDTVFYLLVPLARSMYRKTNRNYLMYILAIAAGGAVTHTLVPPTPGPLVVAATLDIDVGIMILVGMLVGAPAAIVGLIYASVADRFMHVPMRSAGVEPEPLPDEQLPGLLMSLLPVVLPVIMISANTVLNTLADNEGRQNFTASDVTDYAGFRDALVNAEPTTPASRLWEFLSPEMQTALEAGAPASDAEKQAFVAELNQALTQRLIDGGASNIQWLYDDSAFESAVVPSWKITRRKAAADGSTLSAAELDVLERQELLATWAAKNRNDLKPTERARFHRIALDAAFPQFIQRHDWNSPLRRAAGVSSLFGNANLALLLSTAIAIYVLWRQRRPSLNEMSAAVEESLMSGGTIILITAAGYAFGEMLKVAQIGGAIQNLFSTEGNGTGLFYLFMGFGLAALLKIAQGSSTAAMIVGSSMLAPIVAMTDLGFHPVYVATAVASGSLVGSWMNDSGFWIFAKMGGLTESEALKTWTPLLCVLGFVSMGMTILLTFVLPLA